MALNLIDPSLLKPDQGDQVWREAAGEPASRGP